MRMRLRGSTPKTADSSGRKCPTWLRTSLLFVGICHSGLPVGEDICDVGQDVLRQQHFSFEINVILVPIDYPFPAPTHRKNDLIAFGGQRVRPSTRNGMVSRPSASVKLAHNLANI